MRFARGWVDMAVGSIEIMARMSNGGLQFHYFNHFILHLSFQLR